MNNKTEEFLTLTKLKQRGWTTTLIRDLLGDPDKECPNSKYPSGAPLRLYREDRVQEREKSVEWKTMTQRMARRRDGAAGAIQTKQKRLLARASAFEMEIPSISWEDLVERACSYHDHRKHWLDEDPPVTPESPPHLLDAVVIDYLLYEHSNYRHAVREMQGKVGVNDAIFEIDCKAYATISALYPHLRKVCQLQLRCKEILREIPPLSSNA